MRIETGIKDYLIRIKNRREARVTTLSGGFCMWEVYSVVPLIVSRRAEPDDIEKAKQGSCKAFSEGSINN